MSKSTDNISFQGQQKPQGRGSVLPQGRGSSAGGQHAAYGEAPARTFSGNDGRAPIRRPTSEATAALLNATKMSLREQGENLSSDDEQLPRWNVGKRSGPRATLDSGGSGALGQGTAQMERASSAKAAGLPDLRMVPVHYLGKQMWPREQNPNPMGHQLGVPRASFPAAAGVGPGPAPHSHSRKSEPSRVTSPVTQAGAAAAADLHPSGRVHVPIICNGNRGRFLLERQSCVCHCKLCAQRAQRASLAYHEMTPTEFERHSGMAASKKWKYTLRVDKPEAKSCTLGAYLDQLGVLEKSGRTGSGRFIQAAASAVAEAAANTGSIHPLQLPVPGPPEQDDPEISSASEPDDPRHNDGPGYRADSLTPGAAEADDVYEDALEDGDAAAAAAALIGAQREAMAAAARPEREGRGRPRGRPRGGRRGRGRGRGRSANRSRSITPEGLTPEPGYGDGEDGHLGTPPELGAVDAVLNLSRDKWLKPSPAYNRRERKPAIREGPQYQAVVPDGPPLPKPTGSEEEDPRSGTRGPTPEEMRAITAGPEKDAAEALPPDARTDNDSIANVNGKTVLLQRGQRSRKRPVWLKNTVDPHLAEVYRMNRAHQRPFSGLRYETGELDSPQYGSDTSGANGAAAEGGGHRRKRSAAGADYYAGGLDGDAYGGRSELLPVPKRVRTNQRDAPASWRPNASANASPSPSVIRVRKVDKTWGDGQSKSHRLDSCPEVVSWQLTEPQLLFVLVNYQDYQFAGTLMLEARDQRHANQADLPAPALPGALMEVDESHPGGMWAEDEAQGLGASTAPSNMTAPDTEVEGATEARVQPVTAAVPAAAAVPPTADEDGAEVQSHTEVLAKSEADKKDEKVKGNPARRAAAAAEYQRLARSGAPPGTRCALCHKEQEAGEFGEVSLQRGLSLTPDAATNRGLGPLLLVKVSAIANAWVHSQCAVWSPEVYESSEGKLEQVGLAVRRGRMIKCRFCGHRGATLGCHIRSCRTSFHLPCARYNGSRLDGNGRVTCPLHVHLVESEPIIPVPEPEPYDDDGTDEDDTGHYRRGNDHDDPSEETRSDGEVGGRDAATGGRDPSNGGSQHRGASHNYSGRQRSAVATPEDEEDYSDAEDDEDDDAAQDAGAGISAAHPRFLPRKDPPAAPVQAGRPVRAMARAPGTARKRYETLLADADNADREEFSRFGGTVGRSMFRPGRCAVCVEQRKGKCGTVSAPKRCLRRQANSLIMRVGRRPVGRPRKVVPTAAPRPAPALAAAPQLYDRIDRTLKPPRRVIRSGVPAAAPALLSGHNMQRGPSSAAAGPSFAPRPLAARGVPPNLARRAHPAAVKAAERSGAHPTAARSASQAADRTAAARGGDDSGMLTGANPHRKAQPAPSKQQLAAPEISAVPAPAAQRPPQQPELALWPPPPVGLSRSELLAGPFWSAKWEAAAKLGRAHPNWHKHERDRIARARMPDEWRVLIAEPSDEPMPRHAAPTAQSDKPDAVVSAAAPAGVERAPQSQLEPSGSAAHANSVVTEAAAGSAAQRPPHPRQPAHAPWPPAPLGPPGDEKMRWDVYGAGCKKATAKLAKAFPGMNKSERCHAAIALMPDEWRGIYQPDQRSITGHQEAVAKLALAFPEWAKAARAHAAMAQKPDDWRSFGTPPAEIVLQRPAVPAAQSDNPNAAVSAAAPAGERAQHPQQLWPSPPVGSLGAEPLTRQYWSARNIAAADLAIAYPKMDSWERYYAAVALMPDEWRGIYQPGPKYIADHQKIVAKLAIAHPEWARSVRAHCAMQQKPDVWRTLDSLPLESAMQRRTVGIFHIPKARLDKPDAAVSAAAPAGQRAPQLPQEPCGSAAQAKSAATGAAAGSAGTMDVEDERLAGHIKPSVARPVRLGLPNARSGSQDAAGRGNVLATQQAPQPGSSAQVGAVSRDERSHAATAEKPGPRQGGQRSAKMQRQTPPRTRPGRISGDAPLRAWVPPDDGKCYPLVEGWVVRGGVKEPAFRAPDAAFAAQARAVAAGAPMSKSEKAHAEIANFADEWRAMAASARAKEGGSSESAGPVQPPPRGLAPLPDRASMRPMITTMPQRASNPRPMVTTLPVRAGTPHAATLVTTTRLSSSGGRGQRQSSATPQPPAAGDTPPRSSSASPLRPPPSTQKASDEHGSVADKQTVQDAALSEVHGEDPAHKWHPASSPSKAVVA